ncbi:hypothetical protein [Brevundimonas sp. TWP2-3-4b1]|uniref:hypothetical protein n=1 Tax=Brevundimonas sp. TWP2-3-4b1 TaxID=2804580 RepID=UPI003CEC139C
MAIEASCGPVDIHRGLPLPEQITLQALVLLRAPGPDGVHFKPTDIISESESAPVSITFRLDAYRLMSEEAVTIPLKPGSWPSAYFLLIDEDGNPFAQGAVRTPDGLPVCGSLDAAKNRLQIMHHRRS